MGKQKYIQNLKCKIMLLNLKPILALFNVSIRMFAENMTIHFQASVTIKFVDKYV